MPGEAAACRHALQLRKITAEATGEWNGSWCHCVRRPMRALCSLSRSKRRSSLRLTAAFISTPSACIRSGAVTFLGLIRVRRRLRLGSTRLGPDEPLRSHRSVDRPRDAQPRRPRAREPNARRTAVPRKGIGQRTKPRHPRPPSRRSTHPGDLLRNRPRFFAPENRPHHNDRCRADGASIAADSEAAVHGGEERDREGQAIVELLTRASRMSPQCLNLTHCN